MNELHAAATGSSRTAPPYNPLFLVHSVTTMKCLAPVPARATAPTKFCIPITPVTAPAQPTSGRTSTHTPPAAQPPENVTSTQPTTLQSPATVPARSGSISIAAPASDTSDDGSSSDDDAGNNNSHRFASRTATRSFRRSPSMASSGTSVIADSKLQIPKLEKCSAIGKWGKATVFHNCVDDGMDQLLIGYPDPESDVAMVCLGWQLQGEGTILHF